MTIVTLNQVKNTPAISRYLYGQFAEHLGRCIYGGLWVEPDSTIPNHNGLRDDVIQALKALKIPVLRWPGGCFADTYHWQDGIGPASNRHTIINTNWGGVVENNHFGTHEFFELCRQLGCEAYINGNLGSGTVREMAEWVEYMTFDGISPMADLRRKNGQKDPWSVDFFGVGNESWGCGGMMRPEYYADLYRHYQTFIRQFNPKYPLKKIAVGPNIDDYHWTEVVMKQAGSLMDGLSLHHYALASAWEDKRPALAFPDHEWYSLIDSALKMEILIKHHSEIMDRYDPERKVALIVDEWGSWLDIEPGTNPGFLYQQNTLRDAMVAALTLHIFQQHTERVKMANIAQMVNVLQAMVLTEDDKMVLTPTYYVFKLFQAHQDATPYHMDHANLPAHVSLSASYKSNQSLITLCNYDLENEAQLTLKLPVKKLIRAQILTATATDAHNSFEQPHAIEPQAFTTVRINPDVITLTLPAKSIVALEVEA